MESDLPVLTLTALSSVDNEVNVRWASSSLDHDVMSLAGQNVVQLDAVEVPGVLPDPMEAMVNNANAYFELMADDAELSPTRLWRRFARGVESTARSSDWKSADTAFEDRFATAEFNSETDDSLIDTLARSRDSLTFRNHLFKLSSESFAFDQ
jgi:hypothetical protein